MHLIILVIQNPSISQNNKLYRRNYSNDVRPMYTYIIFVMLCIFINARFQNYLKSSNFNSYKDTQWLLMNQRESENKCYMFRQVKRLSHLPGCLSDWQDENGDYAHRFFLASGISSRCCSLEFKFLKRTPKLSTPKNAERKVI